MKFSTIVLIALGIFFVFIVVSITMSIVSNSLCERECNKINAWGHEIIPSGSWKIDDLCVCFFEDKIKSFRLGEK